MAEAEETGRAGLKKLCGKMPKSKKKSSTPHFTPTYIEIFASPLTKELLPNLSKQKDESNSSCRILPNPRHLELGVVSFEIELISTHAMTWLREESNGWPIRLPLCLWVGGCALYIPPSSYSQG